MFDELGLIEGIRPWVVDISSHVHVIANVLLNSGLITPEKYEELRVAAKTAILEQVEKECSSEETRKKIIALLSGKSVQIHPEEGNEDVECVQSDLQ